MEDFHAFLKKESGRYPANKCPKNVSEMEEMTGKYPIGMKSTLAFMIDELDPLVQVWT